MLFILPDFTMWMLLWTLSSFSACTKRDLTHPPSVANQTFNGSYKCLVTLSAGDVLTASVNSSK